MGSIDVTTHVSVTEYFYEVVTGALERTCVEASEGAEGYLVSLLGEFIQARITDEPLSLKLARCGDDPAQRVRVLKEVGDTSLYVTGFFAKSVAGTLTDYYAELGAAAYQELSRRLAGSSRIAGVYRELAAKFPRFVDVLGEVRKQVDVASQDVVTLYEQWLATRADWIERRLRSLGVLVGDSEEVH